MPVSPPIAQQTTIGTVLGIKMQKWVPKEATLTSVGVRDFMFGRHLHAWCGRIWESPDWGHWSLDWLLLQSAQVVMIEDHDLCG